MGLRVLAALTAFLLASSAHAADNTDRKDLLRSIFKSEDKLPDEIFTLGQRRSVSPARILKQVTAVRKELGEILQITGGHGSYSAWTREKRIPVKLSLRADGKISRLRIRKSRKFPQDFEGALKGLQKLPGWVAVLVQKNGADLFEQNASEQLSVGSAFKLSVLVALSAKIKSGEAAWSTGIEIRDGHRTLNSPVLKRMPAGSIMTVQTLAALMMGFDDRTATDILMDFVGPDVVGVVSAARPVATSEEFAKLKTQTELTDAYGEADEDGRIVILDSLADMEAPPAYSALLAADRKINWLISSRRLCEMMPFVKDLKVFPSGHGLTAPADWKVSSLSAGGGAAVRSWTIWLENAKDESFCVSLTWNRGEGVDDAALAIVMVPLIRALNVPEPEPTQAAANEQSASQ